MRSANRVLVSAAVIALIVLGGEEGARAQVPRLLNFQGRLANTSNQPQTGTFSIAFSLWTTPAVGTGTRCFTETLVVSANSGLMNVLIGSGTAGGIVTSCAGADNFTVPYYLQIHISGDVTPMSPRVALTSAPYAFSADRLDGILATEFFRPSPTTGDMILSAGAKLGVGMTPVRDVDAVGYVRAGSLCLGADCRTAWPPEVSSISQGFGITLSPNPITTTGTVSVNPTTVQQRVTGTCTTSQGIYVVNQDGTVGCAAVLATPTCTYDTVTYGTGATCYDGCLGSPWCYCIQFTCQANGSWSQATASSCSALAPKCAL